MNWPVTIVQVQQRKMRVVSTSMIVWFVVVTIVAARGAWILKHATTTTQQEFFPTLHCATTVVVQDQGVAEREQHGTGKLLNAM